MFRTEEEIFGGAAGEQPGSQAAYQKELARQRFLMEMQREFNNAQLALQAEANAVQATAASEQKRLQEEVLKEQRDFNAKSLEVQNQMRDTAGDQGRSARASLVLGGVALVLSAAAILANILLGQMPLLSM